MLCNLYLVMINLLLAQDLFLSWLQQPQHLLVVREPLKPSDDVMLWWTNVTNTSAALRREEGSNFDRTSPLSSGGSSARWIPN